MSIVKNALLNDEQLDAVNTIEGPVLIIAGAGSGKTRVITYRIANMLEKKIPQNAVLALTFTNKAAREMSERVKSLTKRKLTNLTVSTFHSFGVSVLKQHIGLLGYRQNFSIYDSNDQRTIIKECARELKLNSDAYDLSAVQNLFSGIKMGRLNWTPETDGFRQMYDEYIEHLQVYNAVDFDDLISLPIRIFKENPEVLEEYRQRFKYIMVDEFQDTSLSQYEFVKQIALGSRNICVVGDDDQSIYSWRGANYLNIVNFENDFAERREIKLEQNYRSTGTILDAANNVISNNTNRKTKKLWTGISGGNAIEISYPEDERVEAQNIADSIKTLSLKERVPYHDVGVLIRTNNLAAVLEENFLKEKIPYKVSGGASFFQRKEVKDIIAYLKVMVNPDDDVNLLRILNVPRRGIGKNTLQMFNSYASRHECSIYSAISAYRFAADSPLKPKLQGALDEFSMVLEEYRQKLLTGKKMAKTITDFIDQIDYWGYLVAEHKDNDKAARYKYQNISIFCDLLENWEKDPDNVNPNLYSYLNRISLISGDDIEEGDDRGKVNLMTIHASKGLEFEYVFLAGVEDNIIPHARSIAEDENNLEEERRLFYVAITRAKKRLFISSCRTRKVMRELTECVPSPFLEEIPQNLLEVREAAEFTEDDAEAAFAQMRARFGTTE